ncbi:MAG: two-component sensor histidine kinase [Isosphaeraceae bacterium]|nr:two-component sensor histidine kinase [Isosphaeraceae bacterium]
MPSVADHRHEWELATERIVVRIRWFGIIMGYALVETRAGQLYDPWAVRAILALGAGYAALDTAFHRMGEVFLKRWPLFVSTMEAVFIALLCYHDTGLDSPFRWYYLLSALCCAIRYRRSLAWTTCGLHILSLAALALVLPPPRRDLTVLPLTVIILAWSTWASSSLAALLRATGRQWEKANAELERANADLARANAELEHQSAELERRVAERSAALRASQARVIHQEKMAAFGLLAAGIAHEVGNPLAALSSLVQMLQRRNADPYVAEKLDLAGRQLGRIQRTIRELIDFSRPASTSKGPVRLLDVVEEALSIAKYYQRTKERQIATEVPPSLPPVLAVRDHLTQVVLNLVLNAVDATAKGGHIRLAGRLDGGFIELTISDDGRGIGEADRARLFQPYFTTKPQGTGLGLFISRQIAEELGGSLTYEAGPDQGAVFVVRLPALRPAAPAEAEPVPMTIPEPEAVAEPQGVAS